MAERVEDLNLPNSVVTRIIKECLPDGIAVAKDARTAVARAASVFVLFLTSAANASAQKGSRKTITAKDVFTALESTEFGYFVEPLKECLEEFKKSQQVRKEMAAAKKKAGDEARKSTGAEGGEGGAEIVEIMDDEEEDGGDDVMD